MSRIGYKEIKIPAGTTVEVLDGGEFAYKLVKVTGPKGSLEVSLRRGVEPKVEGDTMTFERHNESKQVKSYHGLYRSLVNNMITGVTEGYTKRLEIVGIGYRAEQQGTKVVFSIGYSHKIELEPPVGIEVKIEEQTKITVTGADKQLVGEVAAKIRSFRKPEPYKGKGIRYADEVVKRKSAKNISGE
jgi:large subunit ribosomal protein L6